MKTLFLTILLSCFAFGVYAENLTIKKMAGTVLLNGKIKAQKGKLYKEIFEVKTEKRSFAKFLINQNQLLTLGPDSHIVIQKVGKSKRSLISLLSGKLRGKVPKEKSERHKLFIKTRSASMGVRGTDFLIVYNKENHITSNLTFQGEVDFYKVSDQEILESLREDFDQKGIAKSSERDLLDQLEHHSVKHVRGGNLSGAYPTYDAAISPIQISQSQFRVLENNSTVDQSRTGKVVTGKKAQGKVKLTNKNLIPEPLDEPFEEMDGKKQIAANDKGIRSGGYLDTETGIYVMPPKESFYNEKSGQYEVPSEYGGIDSKSGAYIPPKNVELDPIQGFVAFKDGVKKQIDEFSLGVKKLLGQYKKISRVDARARFDYFYRTKTFENYYGELREWTPAESMTMGFSGFLGRHLFHNKRYLHYIKGELESLWHNRQDEPRVQRNDAMKVRYGYEFHRKHRLLGRKARFVTDVVFENIYTDFKNKDRFDFYSESSGAKIYEQFDPSRRHTIQLGAGMRAFHGHVDQNHGLIEEYFFKNHIHPNIPITFELNFSHRSRKDRILQSRYHITSEELKISFENIMRKTNLDLTGRLEQHERKGRIETKKVDQQYASIGFGRRNGEYLTFCFYYDWLRYKETGSNNLKLQNHQVGTAIAFKF